MVLFLHGVTEVVLPVMYTSTVVGVGEARRLQVGQGGGWWVHPQWWAWGKLGGCRWGRGEEGGGGCRCTAELELYVCLPDMLHPRSALQRLPW